MHRKGLCPGRRQQARPANLGQSERTDEELVARPQGEWGWRRARQGDRWSAAANTQPKWRKMQCPRLNQARFWLRRIRVDEPSIFRTWLDPQRIRRSRRP